LITLGSLFDGIGGFPLAGQRNGMAAIWASEIEPFPIKVSKIRFPDMKHHGDITKIDCSQLDPVDIVTGGSPCQDLSVAGKRAGLAGARSGLFMEQIRIVRELRDAEKRNGRTNKSIRPRFMVWENVPGAFSSNKGEDFRAVLEETARIADETVIIPGPAKGKWNTVGCIMGNSYSIAWRILDAQYWGVPQRRRRIFLVADFGGQSAPEVLFKREGLSRHLAESREAREGIAADAEGSTPKTMLIRSGCDGGGKGPLIQDNKSATLACNNTQTLFTPNPITVDFGRTADRITIDPKVSVTIQGEGGGCGAKTGLYCIPNKTYCIQGNCIDRADTAGCNIKGWTEDVCYTLNTIDRPAVLPFNATQITSPANGNNPKYGDPCHPLCATDYAPHIVQTYSFQCSDEFKETDKASTQSRRQYKDATDLVCSVDCRNMYENPEKSATLQSKPNGGQSLNYQNPVRVGYSVRRLTPLECERLQDYPDGWTDIPGASDSGRYKAEGNSVAVCCPEYVLEGIKEVYINSGVN
jgi:DNA (cytosine-5)-methyltransferase 1